MSKPILSILILISKRPDTVRKCLDSVMPIIEAVSSELILTDTGCGNEVRRIIEEYNATILEFEWCKDFAKARNVGLNVAQGEWILFIDDDEWFENTDEIIDFFRTGEYLQYGYASYIQRNYHDWEGREYFDFAATRMIKRHDGIQFIYAVHEQPNIVIGNRKFLNDYVHHYGYIYKSIEEKIAHKKRDREILEKEYNINPYDVRMALHYVANIKSDDSQKTLEICKKIVDAYKGTENEQKSYALISTMIEMHYVLGEIQEAKSCAEWALNRPINIMVKAHIYGIMSRLYIGQNENENAYASAKNYYDLYLKRFDENYLKFQSPLVSQIFEKYYFCIIIQIGIIAALRISETSMIYEWYDSLSSGKFGIKSDFYNEDMINLLAIKCLDDEEKIADISKNIMNKLCQNKNLDSVITQSIFEACDNVDQLSQFAAIKGNNVSLIFARIASNMLGEYKDNTYTRLELDDFKRIWNDVKNTYQQITKYEMLEYILERIGDIREYISCLTFLEWDRGIMEIFDICSDEDADRMVNRLIEVADEDEERRISIKYAYDKKRLCNKQAYDQKMYFERIDLINSYAENISYRVNNLYSERIINKYENYLSSEEIFGIRMKQIRECIESKDYEGALKVVRDIVESDSEYVDYARDITQYINEANIEDGFSKEMQELAYQIKDKIKLLKSIGKNSEAVETEKLLQKFYK